MSQAPSKKTYVERSTEIVQEMQAYRTADGTLRLPKDIADTFEKYVLGLSALVDKRNKTVEEIFALMTAQRSARKSV